MLVEGGEIINHHRIGITMAAARLGYMREHEGKLQPDTFVLERDKKLFGANTAKFIRIKEGTFNYKIKPEHSTQLDEKFDPLSRYYLLHKMDFFRPTRMGFPEYMGDHVDSFLSFAISARERKGDQLSRSEIENLFPTYFEGIAKPIQAAATRCAKIEFKKPITEKQMPKLTRKVRRTVVSNKAQLNRLFVDVFTTSEIEKLYALGIELKEKTRVGVEIRGPHPPQHARAVGLFLEAMAISRTRIRITDDHRLPPGETRLNLCDPETGGLLL